MSDPTVPPGMSALNGALADRRNLLARLLEQKRADASLHPLSHEQRALWFIDRLAPDSTAYNLMRALRVRPRVYPDTLRTAFRAVLDRHPSLRTTFVTVGAEPHQLIHDRVVVPVETADARGWSNEELRERLGREADLHFDLERGPLLRVKLFTRAPADDILLLVVHHIVCDFWSLEVLVDDLSAIYSALRRGSEPVLPPLLKHYTDHIRSKDELLADAQGERLRAYWHRQFAGELPVLSLATDRPRPPVQTYRGRSLPPAQLGSGLVERLRKLAGSRSATVFTLILAALDALLHRYSGQHDILVGTPFGARPAGFEHVVGYFVNSVVMRADLAGDPSFTGLLDRLQPVVVGAIEHADYPFPLLVEHLQPTRDSSRSPLSQVGFAWDKSRIAGAGGMLPAAQPGGLELEPIAGEQRGALFDLALTVLEVGEALSVSWKYNTDLFDATTIGRLAQHFEILLEGIVAAPAARLSELPLLSAAERRTVTVDWNATAADYPRELCAHQLVERQAAATPGAAAVVSAERRLSYGELDREANRVARLLRRLGVGPGTLVGVCLERSPEMVVGLLGVLKAGAAYVPLDPAYPRERLAFMIADTRMPVLLSQEAMLARLPEHGARVVCLDRDRDRIAAESGEAVASTAEPEDLVYVVFTSGSTGRPKGVEIRHRGLVNLIGWHRRAYSVTAADRATQMAALAFDAAAWELWPYLAAGAAVYLPDEECRVSPSRLLDWLAANAITMCFLVTPMAEILFEHELPHGLALRALLTGADRLRQAPRRELPFAVFNNYGPTETTVISTWAPVEAGRGTGGPPPIGRPLDNTQVYVLDRRLRPVPIGVPGELYIGGDGLARGYLNRPALTAERFIPDPFGERAGSRLYTTGDVCRLLASGDLEFLGRADRQVKLRGFRIELGEIEAALNRHPAVRQAVALLREDVPGDKRLVAYVVCDQAAAAAGELRGFLKERLPEHMVPASIVELDSLPLSPNGKVEVAALPPPRDAGPARLGPPAQPATGVEQVIAAIWRDLLDVGDVGAGDSFFDVGGHSLLVLRVQQRLRQELGVDLGVADLFQYPTIESLAAHITGSTTTAEPAAASRNRAVGWRKRSAQPGDRRIAIVGMAGRFPRARNVGELWRNLRDGVECGTLLGQEELLAAGCDPALIAAPHYVRTAYILEDAEAFDASFFGFSPHEAAICDPQQRVFLETAWEALEDAGYDPARYQGRIGVFGGAVRNTYLLADMPVESETPEYMQVALGNEDDFLATRVSFKLDLKGPSLTVQTACSSSLVAVHLACLSLLSGECEMALAGGVCVLFPQRRGYAYHEGLIFSPDGRCRAFDASARGIVPGQGAGIVVLKRLADALDDGDCVRAVIKGTAINNDGALKVGFSAPSVEGQVEAIVQAHRAAGCEAGTISYIEAHGTGTPLGDPIEVAALTKAFRASTDRKGFCAIGSLKTNLGHPGAAAGVAGLIKTVLALEHEQLPPILNYETPNPEIDFENSPFYVNDRLAAWKAGSSPRRAGVNSFGIGGTNAHAVVEEAPQQSAGGPARPWHLLVISAKTGSALDAATVNLRQYLEQQPGLDLADVAYTLQVGRGAFSHRRAAVGRDLRGAVEALAAQSSQAAVAGRERPVAFLFPGQGAQHPGMAAELYRTEAGFRQHIDFGSEFLRPHLGLDLRTVVFPAPHDAVEATARLDQTQITQPALFLIEYALARLWIDWGVRPQAMIGHSIGEYVAACLAGVLGVESALLLVAARASLMQRLPAGAMLAVAVPEAELGPWLEEGLSLAAVNGPSSCVLSGPIEAIEAVHLQLSRAGVSCSRLRTSHAFHSAAMDPILQSLRAVFDGRPLRPPEIRFVSNLTGTWITAAEATDPGYWVSHVRQTVRFSDGLRTLFADPQRVLIEVGPAQTLTGLARRHPDRRPEQLVVPSLPRPHEEASELTALLTALGQAWAAGVPVDWAALHRGEQRRRVQLPTYPFERQRHWRQPRRWGRDGGGGRSSLGARRALADWFYAPSWKRSVLPRPALTELLAAEPLCWLIFSDAVGVGDRVAGRLEEAGHTVTLVRAGDRFTRLAEGSVTIDPAAADDYDALLGTLRAAGRMPARVVHLWSVSPLDPASLSLAAVDAAQELGLFSLLALAQAVGRSGSTRPLQLAVVSNNMHEVTGAETIRPEKATLLGATKIIPEEVPSIACRSIDLDLAEPAPPGERADDLLAEILAAGPDAVCAHRGSHRWIQRFEPLRLEAARSSARIRPGGVYLITGGLGGIGLTLAEHLANSARVRLVLTGRSPFPAREEWEGWLAARGEGDACSTRILRLLQLEARGAETLVAQADVSSLEQMEAVLARAQERFGPIRGVVHSAGVPDYAGVIQKRTRAVTSEVLASKVRGTVVLDLLLRHADLDFFVLCSSLASVVSKAKFGEVAYCAANEFLDAFAYRRDQRARGCTTAINWPEWDSVGMGVAAYRRWADTHRVTADFAALAANRIDPAEGMAVFDRVLSSRLPRLLVSPHDLPSVIAHSRPAELLALRTDPAWGGGPETQATQGPRPALESAYVSPRNPVEVALAGIWQQVLGIAEIGVQDDFFDLGGDSLVAAQILAKVRGAFDLAISHNSLLDNPTVERFAARIQSAVLARQLEEVRQDEAHSESEELEI